MTTSRETIRELITRMKQEFAAAATGNLQENRRHFEQAGLKTPMPDGIRVENVQLSADITADWIIPAGADKHSIILYLHGGGFSVGSSISHRPICSRIANAAGCHLLAINYRLAPEHRYPAALDDALASYQWLCNQYPQARIFIAGDSAGGGLTMAVLLALKQRKLAMPAGAIGISAWLDLECTSASYQSNRDVDLLATAEGLRFVGRGYASKQINRDPLVSPFYATDLHGLCPLLIQVGSAETLLDENTAFAGQAKKDGVNAELQVWPNMVHVWHTLHGLIPEAAEATDAIGKWINKN